MSQQGSITLEKCAIKLSHGDSKCCTEKQIKLHGNITEEMKTSMIIAAICTTIKEYKEKERTKQVKSREEALETRKNYK